MDLTPVGLSKDGKRLVLVSARGDEYHVVVDDRLRAALRGDHARLGQLEMTMESTLRPRDIQARIRAGESAEDVAAAAQTTLDKIMVYAGPVLAERAHVAQVAQASSVRRRPLEDGADPANDTGPIARTLQEAALQHLRTVGVRDDDVSWDAWRRDDGRWTLVAEYVTRGEDGEVPHRAEFSYDQRGRYVTADDDEALLLTGELRVADPARPAGRRLAAVPTQHTGRPQDELPLGDDAIELVRDEPSELSTTGSDGDWIAPDRSERPERRVRAEYELDRDSGPPDQDGDREDAVADTVDDTVADTVEDTVEVAEARAPRRKGRASVPSWDEIMFGGGKHD
jgi:hypothetical protein